MLRVVLKNILEYLICIPVIISVCSCAAMKNTANQSIAPKMTASPVSSPAPAVIVKSVVPKKDKTPDKENKCAIQPPKSNIVFKSDKKSNNTETIKKDNRTKSEKLFEVSFGYSFGSLNRNLNDSSQKIKEDRAQASVDKSVVSQQESSASTEDRSGYWRFYSRYSPKIETNLDIIDDIDDLEYEEDDDDISNPADPADKAEKNPDKEKIKDEFYSIYSEKFGIDFDGTEDQQLIMAIDEWLGTRYKWGGCSKYGIDCSCLIKSIYEDVYGIELSRSSSTIFYNDTIPVQKEDLKEGDIICFKTKRNRINHIGLYLKDNKFVHASRRRGVVIDDLDGKYYKKRFFSGGRIIDKAERAKAKRIISNKMN